MESQAKAKKLTEEASSATKVYKQALSDLQKAQNAYKKALQEDAVEIQKVRYETTELNKTNKEAAKEALGVVTAYQKFAKEVNQAKRDAKNLGSEMIDLENRFKRGEITQREYNRQLNKLSKEFVEAKVKALGLDQQLKKLDASVGDNQRNVGNYRSALGGLTVSFKNLLAAFGVVGAIDMFANLAQSSFETIKQLDAQNASLKQIFETENQVAFQKEYLADVTNRYGLELISATDGYTKYAAAIKGTALEGEKGRVIFASFSGASSKLGLNAEAQTGIFKALEQMISKGTVQAEELRGQLGDRMPGAFKLFADAAGVSTKELGVMMKAGNVLADDILPKVAEKLNEVYSLDNTTKVDTLAAAQNRFKNSWTSFLDETAGNKEIINGLAVGMEGLGVVLNVVLDTLIVKGADGTSVVHDLVDVIQSLLEAVGDMAEGLGLIDEKTKNNLFSLNQFKNDLKAMGSVISVVSSALKYLVETVTNFFSTMFQSDGWDKFTSKMESSANKLLKAIGMYNKVQDGLSEANKKGELYKGDSNPYVIAWNDARKAKLAYFQLNGKYFDTKTGRNTGKSLDDYVDRDGKLIAKEKTAPYNPNSDDKTKKAKPYRGSRLSGEQRDYLMSLQALRDLELAINEKRFTDGTIQEKEYLKNIEKINVVFLDKKIAYIKGANAKEKLERAKAELEKAKLTKDTQKKIFDIDYKANEESYKIRMEAFEKQNQDYEQNDYLSNTDRLTRQIEVDNQMIAESSTYWQTQIDLAKAANQETLTIERKRDEELNKLESNRFKRVSSSFDKFKSDTEAQIQYLQTLKGITFEEQKRTIFSDKNLSNKQKEFLLDVAILENQILLNKIEIENLNLIRKRLEEKSGSLPIGTLLTPEEQQILADTIEQIEKLENTNIVIGIELKEKISPEMEALRDVFANGFRDLGLNNFADEFTELFTKIKAETANWKDYMAAAFALVADLAGQYVEKRKQKEIDALDEQLKHTQETTEQELDFINARLDRLNEMDNLSKEQTEERNALEDEARVIKEQQFQREKQIAIQKARAEQKASANQALIGGLAGAAKALPNFAAAAASIAFGALMAGLIMTKDPTPQYFVGRKGGKAETAWTQEKGREIITNKKGNIKSLGSDSGPVLTKLSEGDNVFTAMESVKMLKSIPEINVGAHIHRIDNSKLSPIIIQKDNIDYDKLASKVGEEFGRKLKHFDKISYFEDEDGNIFKQEGGKIPIWKGKRRENKTIIIKSTRNERN